jgi:hypothetical protein
MLSVVLLVLGCSESTATRKIPRTPVVEQTPDTETARTPDTIGGKGKMTERERKGALTTERAIVPAAAPPRPVAPPHAPPPPHHF